jgi:hypothetical protein
MQKITFLMLCLVGLQFSIYAQDIITRKNGQVLKVKIVEVGTTEIKYKIFGDDDSPIYVLEKDRISKLKYESGREEVLANDTRDMEQYTGQKKQGIKVNFLSPLMGHTMISYERSPKLGQSFEVSLSIIGAGKNRELDYYSASFSEKNVDQSGIGVGVGYKFIKLPNFQTGNLRYTHIMQGSYAKPALYFGSFKENVVVYKGSDYVLERPSITFGAFQLELGRQWVLGDAFLLDIYGGLGLGFDNRKEDGYWIGSPSTESKSSSTSYNYMNTRAGYSPGISFNGGIKLGVLF